MSDQDGSHPRFHPDLDGFWCFPKFSRARRPEHLMLWCGLNDFRLTGDAETPAPDEKFNKDLTHFDSITSKLALVPTDLIKLRCNEDVQIVAGLDQSEAHMRWRSVVARAYWEAWRVAEGHAAEIRAIDAIYEIFNELKPRERVFFDSLEQGLALLEKVRWGNKGDYQDARENLQDGRRGAAWVLGKMRDVSGRRLERGSYPDVGRLFFATRLAEAFSLCTGTAPPFHMQSTDQDSTGWFGFLAASEQLSQLAGGISFQGHDALMRTIAEVDARKNRINDLADLPKPDFNDGYRGQVFRNVELGHLQSVGIMIDYKVPARDPRLIRSARR